MVLSALDMTCRVNATSPIICRARESLLVVNELVYKAYSSIVLACPSADHCFIPWTVWS